MTNFNQKKRHRRFSTGAFATVLALLLGMQTYVRPAVAQSVADDELTEIAVEAYLYAYPVVIMDVTRQLGTNCESPDVAKFCAPANQFVHAPVFPDATFTDVVRPNADTLYSPIWFDVTKEPLLVHVPDSGGRYYLLPMLDMWSDVFSSPGSRTTGTGEQTFAIAGPGWEGSLPEGVRLIRSPTATGWMIGRTQANGKDDFPNVHKFQAGIKAVPLSAWGKAYKPPKNPVDPKIPTEAPVEQISKMEVARDSTSGNRGMTGLKTRAAVQRADSLATEPSLVAYLRPSRLEYLSS